jgi:hypothetical protein
MFDWPLVNPSMKHIMVRLLAARRAFGLLSKIPPTTAVVFVHGFWGKPRSTWVDFSSFIEQNAKWDNCDIYFYGHWSNKQVRSLADNFLPFLRGVAAGGNQLVASSAAYPSGLLSIFGPGMAFWVARGAEGYKRIVLVGHSAGALIIRETVNLIINEMEEAHTSGKAQVDPKDQMILDAKVRFFAPAHKGLLGAGVLGIAQNVPVLDIIPALCLEWNPLYQNIARQVVVNDIEKETEKFWNAYQLPALNTLSVFGGDDQIVNIGRYEGYELKERLKSDQNHTSICKPRLGFPFPEEFVADVL